MAWRLFREHLHDELGRDSFRVFGMIQEFLEEGISGHVDWCGEFVEIWQRARLRHVPPLWKPRWTQVGPVEGPATDASVLVMDVREAF